MENLPSVKQVSAALKRRRTQLGLSLREVERECGVTHSVLHRLECKPSGRIRAETIEKVVRWLTKAA